MAARAGHGNTVACLLELGASPDEPDERGFKPLHYAAMRDHHATAQILIDAGVNLLTPMTKERRHPSFLRAKPLAGGTPLGEASRNGCVESVRVMLPYLSSEDHRSSLRAVVTFDRGVLARHLVDAADLDMASKFGGDLMLIAAWGFLYVVKLLMSRGANPEYVREPNSSKIDTRDPYMARLSNLTSLLLALCHGAA
ncbi:ankyrin repeat-containing domain protein [Aspergillus heterothallicus]